MPYTKSILIVGGSGFLGTHLCLRLRQGHSKVFATYFAHHNRIPGVTYIPCNIENRNWVKKLISTTQPDVIVYLAGKNDYSWAEKNVKQAETVHSSGPATLANMAEILQPRFIFVSNSYVFDGSRGNYHEVDTVSPNSALGRMKLGGENVVKSKSLNYIILRSSPLIGRGNGLNLSFLDRLRMNLDRNMRAECSVNELHSYAPVEGLIEVIQLLIDSGIKNRVFHYGGLTKVSYFDFAKGFAKKFGYDEKLVIPKSRGTTDEQTLTDFSLNSTPLVEILKIKPFLLEECFDLIQKKLISDL